jgi:hypothetical protein
MSETKNPSLVDLHNELQMVSEDIIRMGGELTPETEKELEQALEELCRKTDGYGAVIKQLESKAAFWKDQKKECEVSQKTIENAIERLKSRMKYVLSQTEGEALQGEFYRFFLAKTAPSMDVNVALLPGQYKKTELVVSPDKTAIKAAMDRGETIPGVTMIETKALRSGRPK